MTTAQETAAVSSGEKSHVTLINMTNFPPGGWKYREPSLNWELPRDIAMLGLDDAVQALQMVRAQNPAADLSPSYKDCLEAIKLYTCVRLKYDPRWCGLPPAEQQKVNEARTPKGVSFRKCAGCGRR